MTTADDQIAAIKARQKAIEAEIETLRDEADELAIALKVLGRYSASPDLREEGKKGLGPARPEGVPPLFEMTVSVIQDAQASGKAGLRGSEIVAAIGKKYWPGVQRTQILPAIYGFAKKGRIRKMVDGSFTVPITIKGAA